MNPTRGNSSPKWNSTLAATRRSHGAVRSRAPASAGRTLCSQPLGRRQAEWWAHAGWKERLLADMPDGEGDAIRWAPEDSC